jgi:hypothetical protein
MYYSNSILRYLEVCNRANGGRRPGRAEVCRLGKRETLMNASLIIHHCQRLTTLLLECGASVLRTYNDYFYHSPVLPSTG